MIINEPSLYGKSEYQIIKTIKAMIDSGKYTVNDAVRWCSYLAEFSPCEKEHSKFIRIAKKLDDG